MICAMGAISILGFIVWALRVLGHPFCKKGKSIFCYMLERFVLVFNTLLVKGYCFIFYIEAVIMLFTIVYIIIDNTTCDQSAGNYEHSLMLYYMWNSKPLFNTEGRRLYLRLRSRKRLMGF